MIETALKTTIETCDLNHRYAYVTSEPKPCCPFCLAEGLREARKGLRIDGSMLTPEDKAFVERWARKLDIPIPVLLGRILEGAIDGDNYIELRPNNFG